MANETIKNFSQFIALHANGSTNHLFSEAMHEMIAELQNRAIDRGGKQKGKITLEVDIAIEKGMLLISCNHPKSKMPLPVGQQAVFWLTPENYLSACDPKQADMFRDVTGSGQEVRTA